MTEQVVICSIEDWKAAVVSSNDPSTATRSITYCLGNDLVFNRLDDLYVFPQDDPENVVLYLTLYGSHTFDGAGFTITVDAPPFVDPVSQEEFVFRGLTYLGATEETGGGLITFQNVSVVLGTQTLVNFYGSTLVIDFSGVGPFDVTCRNITVQSSAQLQSSWCFILLGAPYFDVLTYDRCFVLIKSDSTEVPHELDQFCCMFGNMGKTVTDCALVSQYAFTSFYPCFVDPQSSLLVEGAVMQNLYVDLRFQQPIPTVDTSPVILWGTGYGVLTIQNAWIWWGPPDTVASVALVAQLGVPNYDPPFEGVPGFLTLNNVQTNANTAAGESLYGSTVDQTGNTMLSQTVWEPFPFVGDGYDYAVSPPSLTSFSAPPFLSGTRSVDAVPPFAIPVLSVQAIDADHAVVRASDAVRTLYNLDTRPLRFWLQTNDDSRSTRRSSQSDWTSTPIAEAVTDLSPPLGALPPTAKLQLGLSTFSFPRQPQYGFFSVPYDASTNAIFFLGDEQEQEA
ncbi:hypothetical protein EBZ80_21010 [bacterium]|nr:hypothetical protein [bacterium]